MNAGPPPAACVRDGRVRDGRHLWAKDPRTGYSHHAWRPDDIKDDPDPASEGKLVALLLLACTFKPTLRYT